MTTLRILVGCEFSGIVREAFNQIEGIEAWSCDLVDTEIPGNHIKDNILTQLHKPWTALVVFPPCDHLCVSGARWFKEKQADGRQERALKFVQNLMDAPIQHIAIENPIGIISTHIRRPDQIIQPWQFGHGETKATCLWLKNLPKLHPTQIVNGRQPRIHYESPGPQRSKNRSRTLTGIAQAMANQWSAYIKGAYTQ